jgi:cell division protein FtsI/penicillin-binding protein 2
MGFRWGRSGKKTQKRAPEGDRRLFVLKVLIIVGLSVVGMRLFVLQVLSGAFYAAIASDQHSVFEELIPERGAVYLRDPKSRTGTFPAAINREVTTIYAVPRDVEDPGAAAAALAPLLEPDETLRDAKKGQLLDKLLHKDDPYEPLLRRAPDTVADAVRALGLKGIGFAKEPMRFYPEAAALAHVVGFVGMNDNGERIGRYGIEGWWDEQLSGTQGYLQMERDPVGRLIGSVDHSVAAAVDGSDLTLTIDRTIQYMACEKLQAYVERFSAAGGSVVIMDPKTGAVLAMCNVPNFDPNEYGKVEDVAVYNNAAIITPYEPGSVFKPFTMAAAIDAGKVTPSTTYEDKGEVKIGPYTIRNSDLKANGVQTMTQVLEKSLNTGVIFAVEELGPEKFRQYIEDFGFGSPTGIELETEAAGDVSALAKHGDIWSATASFGQGITTTPLQLATAYGAIANGGKLMRPYIVAEVRHPDGTVDRTEPHDVRQVISKRSASLVAGMLANVVENGHGKRAGVPGYFVGGKTGTAQIAAPGGGYLKDATMGSFAGFAPVDDPAFVMAVKIERPQGVSFAESTAAPLFGEIADFLLHYMEIPPERPL